MEKKHLLPVNEFCKFIFNMIFFNKIRGKDRGGNKDKNLGFRRDRRSIVSIYFDTNSQVLTIPPHVYSPLVSLKNDGWEASIHT